MTKSIQEHEGRKYLRTIVGWDANDPGDYGWKILVDVYAVLDSFEVTDQAVGQAVKKLLCASRRGKGNRLQDLVGAEAALARALDRERQKNKDEAPTTCKVEVPPGSAEPTDDPEETRRIQKRVAEILAKMGEEMDMDFHANRGLQDAGRTERLARWIRNNREVLDLLT